MNEAKKPDYLDHDWTALVKDRQKKWAEMMKEYEARGIRKIPLWADGNAPAAHLKGFVPGLVLYPPQEGEKRGLLVICPGGGFAFKSSNEGKEIAEFFYGKGLNVAILDYAVNGSDAGAMGPKSDPATLRAACEDARRAIRLLRAHADDWGIRPDKIGIGGFSAGGMVTSLLLTHYDGGDPEHADPVERVSCRPDATFQMYGSFRNSPGAKGQGGTGLGFDFAAAHRSAETDYILHLPVDVPPMFLAQTDADYPGNILDMGRAYLERGVPFEVHLFHGGPHGGGLYDGKHEDAHLAEVKLAVNGIAWARRMEVKYGKLSDCGDKDGVPGEAPGPGCQEAQVFLEAYVGGGEFQTGGMAGSGWDKAGREGLLGFRPGGVGLLCGRAL